MELTTAVWAWVHAHPIVSIVATIILALRRVPADRWATLERDWPRTANLVRTARAAFPDLEKAALAFLYGVVLGRPWGDPPGSTPSGPNLTAPPYRDPPPAPPEPPAAARTHFEMAAFCGGIVSAMGIVFALVLSGCPGLPKPDGCPPWAMRCSADGTPEVCSGSQRWTRADRPCASSGTTCCRAVSPSGREVYACVPADKCVPEPDAGAISDGGDAQ